MNGVIITNEVKRYHGIAVSLCICNDCFLGPFAIASLILRILKALCLLVPFRVDVFVPEVFRVQIEVIVIDFQLKGCMCFKIIGCLTRKKDILDKYDQTG